VLAQLVVSGLAAGSLYGIMALGLILIYKTTHILNFGQGDMTMFTTFVAYLLLTAFRWPFPAALAGALLSGLALGVLVDRGIMRWARQAPVTSLFIATLGVGMILQAVAGWIWGYDTKPFPYALRGRPIFLGDVVLRQHDLLVLIVTVLISLALFVLFKFTKVGVAMRATSQNRRAAQLMGISVDRMGTLSWALGLGTGAVAGCLVAPIVFLDLTSMVLVMIKAIAAAVLGGFTSLPGAVVGGLLLGVIENLFGGYMPSAIAPLKTTFVFVLIILVLVVRPHGLLGERTAGGGR
jgi:branched-chain amino acid transport system permease protein